MVPAYIDDGFSRDISLLLGEGGIVRVDDRSGLCTFVARAALGEGNVVEKCRILLHEVRWRRKYGGVVKEQQLLPRIQQSSASTVLTGNHHVWTFILESTLTALVDGKCMLCVVGFFEFDHI